MKNHHNHNNFPNILIWHRNICISLVRYLYYVHIVVVVLVLLFNNLTVNNKNNISSINLTTGLFSYIFFVLLFFFLFFLTYKIFIEHQHQERYQKQKVLFYDNDDTTIQCNTIQKYFAMIFVFCLFCFILFLWQIPQIRVTATLNGWLNIVDDRYV